MIVPCIAEENYINCCSISKEFMSSCSLIQVLEIGPSFQSTYTRNNALVFLYYYFVLTIHLQNLIYRRQQVCKKFINNACPSIFELTHHRLTRTASSLHWQAKLPHNTPPHKSPPNTSPHKQNYIELLQSIQTVMA